METGASGDRGFERVTARELARWALVAYLVTFAAARSVVLLIMLRWIPDLYLHLGETHVHHLNYGIMLLSVVAGVLLLWPPTGAGLRVAAVAYGIGLGLTFDEFGMWLHLGGSYWQRASFDAVALVAGLLGLLALAPPLRRFRPGHWWAAALVALALLGFSGLLLKTLGYLGRVVGPRLQHLEADGPP